MPKQSTDQVPSVGKGTKLTEILLTPQPIQSSFPLPFPCELNDPPVVQSLTTPSRGRTRSVAIYTWVSVSTESMYLIL